MFSTTVLGLILLVPTLYFLTSTSSQSTLGKIMHLFRNLSAHSLVLPYTPNGRFSSTITVVLALLVLVFKQVTGIGGRLGKVRDDGTVLLPALWVRAPIRVSREEVQAYEAAVEGHSSLLRDRAEEKPGNEDGTPLFLLAALTAPLLASLLLQLPNPIRPLGSVNVRNTIVFHRPDLLSVLVPSGASGPTEAPTTGNDADTRGSGGLGLVAQARMGGLDHGMLGRRVKRGVEYDTVIDVWQNRRRRDDEASRAAIGDETADSGTGELLFTLTFTALALVRFPPCTPHYDPTSTVGSAASPPSGALGEKSVAARASSSGTSPAPAPPSSTPYLHTPAESEWAVDPDPSPLPLLRTHTSLPYARISKDYNPIHISPVLAKMFGYKGCIAHGNAVVGMIMARAVATAAQTSDAETSTPADGGSERQALGGLWSSSHCDSPKPNPSREPIWLSVEFRRPVLLPSSPSLRWAAGRVQVIAAASREDTHLASQSAQGQAQLGDIKVLVDIRSGQGSAVPPL